MAENAGHSTWCKICGITTLADAEAAQAAGADALGFNCFADSPRFVDLDVLAELSRGVRITRVGLFVNAGISAVEAVLARTELDLLQFQGDEDEQFCSGFGLPYMKGVRMRADVDVRAYAEQFSSAWALLLDAYVDGAPGGTGMQFDWQLWPQDLDCRLVLAGGLNPANVADAITQLQPFGVDVCGGVEGPVKGQKDHHKITAFLQEVRRVRRN